MSNKKYNSLADMPSQELQDLVNNPAPDPYAQAENDFFSLDPFGDSRYTPEEIAQMEEASAKLDREFAIKSNITWTFWLLIILALIFVPTFLIVAHVYVPKHKTMTVYNHYWECNLEVEVMLPSYSEWVEYDWYVTSGYDMNPYYAEPQLGEGYRYDEYYDLYYVYAAEQGKEADWYEISFEDWIAVADNGTYKFHVLDGYAKLER